MNLSALENRITAPDSAAIAQARSRWDSIAKPLGSLGLLEDAVVQIAGLTGNANVQLKKRRVLVFCADNGVVAEGVTQTGQEVTALVAGNIAAGKASVCHMAEAAGADVLPVDVGMIKPAPGVLDRRISAGTANMAKGPAMTREQALAAIKCGMDLVRESAEKGISLILTGEMGIGNTTTSSAMCSVFLNLPVSAVTGRGAGLSNTALVNKIDVIERALRINQPDPADPLDVLSKLGGYDIAAMTGVFLGGAVYRVPVMIDGFISAVSALTAARICPKCRCAMLATHVSAEPAAVKVLDTLALKPMICAGLRLGEGTGALCALPMLDMALSVYHNMSTFQGIGMQAYTHQGDLK